MRRSCRGTSKINIVEISERIAAKLFRKFSEETHDQIIETPEEILQEFWSSSRRSSWRDIARGHFQKIFCRRSRRNSQRNYRGNSWRNFRRISRRNTQMNFMRNPWKLLMNSRNTLKETIKVISKGLPRWIFGKKKLLEEFSEEASMKCAKKT